MASGRKGDAVTTPTKTTDDQRRVYRGGSWRRSSATIVRATVRFDLTPTNRSYYFGFRCAQRGARMPLKVSLG